MEEKKKKQKKGHHRRVISTSKREDWEKGQGPDDLRENEFEELDGVAVQLPEFRVRSQYTQDMAICSEAHNQPD